MRKFFFSMCVIIGSVQAESFVKKKTTKFSKPSQEQCIEVTADMIKSLAELIEQANKMQQEAIVQMEKMITKGCRLSEQVFVQIQLENEDVCHALNRLKKVR